MGVKYDRVLDAFDSPLGKLAAEVNPPPGKVTQIASPAGYLLGPEANDSFVAINRLLKNNAEVYSIKSSFKANGRAYPPGTRFIPAKAATFDTLQEMAREIGLTFDAVAARPDGEAMRLRRRRIALWDRVDGSVPSGWTRLVLEKFEFPFTVIYPPDLDAGDLSRKFDVLIFVDDSVAAPVSALQKFIQDGGTVLAIGHSTRLGFRMGLPIVDALSELPPAKFYVPGSIVQAKVDNTDPLAFGMPERADLFFDSSPAFRLKPDAGGKSVKVVGWYDSRTPLRSGWAWGQEHLESSAAVIDATVGKGKLFLYGPEILFRSQSHGTYKLLFNGIYYIFADKEVF